MKILILIRIYANCILHKLGKLYKLQKKKPKNSLLVVCLNSQNNPSNISVRSCHFCAQNFPLIPIFLRAKPTDHTYLATILPLSCCLHPSSLASLLSTQGAMLPSGSLHLLNLCLECSPFRYSQGYSITPLNFCSSAFLIFIGIIYTINSPHVPAPTTTHAHAHTL